MPKLLSINNYHYRRGGSDVVYLDHAALMEAAGWHNAFFSMQHPNNLASPWSAYFVDELEFGYSYPLLDKLKMAGKVVYSLEARKKLKQLLEVFPADVAHLHCIYHHLSPAIVPVLAKAGVPVVMTAHDLKLACPAYKMLNHGGICERCKGGNLLNVVRHRCIHQSLPASAVVALESLLHQALKTYQKHLAKVIVPSRFFLEKFVEWGWPREKFVYIPNYVAAEDFRPAYEPGNYFLYFGRLSIEKGIATLIRAASISRVRIRIVGTGPEEKSLRALAAECGVNADFLGYRSGAELHALIAQARAVILPSEWYENAPMSVLESYASGKPVVGANIGGIPELIRHEETGWLFESGNVEELAQQLAAVEALPAAILRRMGEAGRAMVVERFSKQRYADSMLKLYSSLGSVRVMAAVPAPMAEP